MTWRFLFLWLATQTATAAESPKYPSVLEEIAAANLPAGVCLKIEESSFHPMSGEKKAVFKLYIEEKSRTFGMQYLSAALNPAKSAIFLNHGEDLWTLDSTGGQVRKIAYYKKSESVNGTPLIYWDIFPLLLVQRPYEITADKSLSANTRAIQLKSNERSIFKRIQFQFDKNSRLLRKINLFSHNRQLRKEIIFQEVSGAQAKIFPFHRIKIKDHHKNTSVILEILSVEPVGGVPPEILNIPSIR